MEIYDGQSGPLNKKGHELCRKVDDAMRPIVEYCVENDIDLRLANHRIGIEIDSMFLTKILEKRLGPTREERLKEKAE